jgi:predicted RNA binding protein YcfA (HicA-like mRNA interferase family)
MKLPRDISGEELVKGLRRVGYEIVRQTRHAYLTTRRNGEHHIAVPMHDTIKVGTLAAILAAVADHLAVDRDELLGLMRL